MHDINDGDFGQMVFGWYQDESDGEWHYLDPETGVMAYGEKVIDGVTYYFNTTNDISESKWSYNEEDRKWTFEHNENEKGSYGSLVGEPPASAYQLQGAEGLIEE